MLITQATITKRFKALYPNKNFMTPDVLKIDTAHYNDFVYELSEGIDMDGRPMYGVTVMELGGYGVPDKQRHDLSKSFIGSTAKKDALKYIKGL